MGISLVDAHSPIATLLVIVIVLAITSQVIKGPVTSPLQGQTFLPTQTSTVFVPQSLLRTSGTNIIDANGNTMILRGINYDSYECENIASELHLQSDYAIFASLGFNIVRLPMGWGGFEPQPGTFNESYLAIVNQDVQWAQKYGLYIVLDMHQVDWSPWFPGGCGSPNWAVSQYPQTTGGMQAAMTNFWTNTTLQTHYINIWKQLATIYANTTTVAGYDLMNEPQTYNGDYGSVQSFFMSLIQSIRSVDNTHIVFMEPVNFNIQTVYSFDSTQNVVWSPHIYKIANFVSDYTEVVVSLKMPMWIGEYGDGDGVDCYNGTFNCYGVANVNSWLQNAVALFNQYKQGAAWWPYQTGPITEIPEVIEPTQQFLVKSENCLDFSLDRL